MDFPSGLHILQHFIFCIFFFSKLFIALFLIILTITHVLSSHLNFFWWSDVVPLFCVLLKLLMRTEKSCWFLQNYSNFSIYTKRASDNKLFVFLLPNSSGFGFDSWIRQDWLHAHFSGSSLRITFHTRKTFSPQQLKNDKYCWIFTDITLLAIDFTCFFFLAKIVRLSYLCVAEVFRIYRPCECRE